MYLIKLKRIAANDIDDIAAYIQQDNPARAESFVVEISAKIGAIAERPLSFPARDDIETGLRSALHGNYLIFFIIRTSEIEILRIVHGARDLGNLF
jgi:toxin ParE1/3/4